MDVLSLAQQHIVLTSEGSHAYRGQCPRCGDAGGFVVAQDKVRGGWRAWCNCCGDNKGMDARDLQRLLGVRTPRTPAFSPQASTPQPAPAQPFDVAHWKRNIGITRRNLAQPSSAGWAYLESRGLVEETWSRFDIGYGHRNQAEAILIPWYRSGSLIGGRYRLLNPPDKHQRYSWWKNSQCHGALYGSHTHQGRDMLIICEGELNAMSIYQAAGDRFDVLSTGSENAPVPTGAQWAQRWQRVYCWFDKPHIAQGWARALGGTMVSLPGVDPSDLLQAGELQQFMETYL